MMETREGYGIKAIKFLKPVLKFMKIVLSLITHDISSEKL